ncbi:MAG: dimethylsulfonioproprionate lyase family protein [Litoreibacter sp.]|uniref:dimethylsulfonioproprionate lyase family protein n=1 Tax=Litoreibacter sp. TaxID=1969459 RepID=UPI00329A27AB
MPKALIKKYAYCEVLGPRGSVQTGDLIIGFVMFAPSTTYPKHSHSEIEESYISIAGSWSENNSAVFSPGSLILNTSGSKHASPPATLIHAFWPMLGSDQKNDCCHLT